ncbi:MAG: RecQ family ATP-dependent DNA helicase [bacterium]|nr:RecQ family ATP-dependent DNA helicase [bacterium]
MVERTARKGRNAGGKFWGCSAYPRCKGTLDISGNPAPSSTRAAGASPGQPVRACRHWSSPPGLHGTARVFVPGAGRSAAPGRGAYETPRWNHACISLTGARERRPLGRAEAVVLHVAYRILCRGESPPVEPRLAEELGKCETIRRPPVAPRQRWWSSPDGSAEEEAFLYEILPQWLDDHQHCLVHPQVEMAALVTNGDILAASRVDFAFLHPARSGRAIVIEIDGDQHAVGAQAANDLRRDDLLRGAGHEVYRIPASEVRQGFGPQLDAVKAAIDGVCAVEWPAADLSAVAAHQAQLGILTAIEDGLLPCSVDEWVIGVAGAYADCLTAGIRSLERLLWALQDLYGGVVLPARIRTIGEGSNDRPTLSVVWDDSGHWYAPHPDLAHRESPSILIIPGWLPTTTPIGLPPRDWVEPRRDVQSKTLESLLHFVSPAKMAFRDGQEESLRRCLFGQDALVLLPTGAGKSLIFQMAAILLPGMTLVVAPLVALMEDQVDNLRRDGFDRVTAISTATTRAGQSQAIQETLRAGVFALCYVSPERLQIQEFRESLLAVRATMPIPLVAIDEAHCVSEWGHDFRPAYLNLARNARKYGRRAVEQKPSLVGLTGTASRAVLRDLQNELAITDLDAVITPSSFDRAELSYEVQRCRSDEKGSVLEGVMRAQPQRIGMRHEELYTTAGQGPAAGIVFCPHAKGAFGAEEVAFDLSKALSLPIETYHGQMDAGAKSATAMRFKDNRFPVLVSTKAFGMGIDKPNVRFTVHYGMTSSLEAFYQEAGRAGRDGKPAHCTMIASVDDDELARRLLDPSMTASTLRQEYESRGRGYKDDIAHSLYFHTQSFEGTREEAERVDQVVAKLADFGRAGETVLEFEKESKSKRRAAGRQLELKDCERALHRLILLGAVEDYTVDYSAGFLRVRTANINIPEMVAQLRSYVASYSQSRADQIVSELAHVSVMSLGKAVIVIAARLVEFVYETVEAGRRAAIREMWRWSERGASDELRRHLLDYLQETQFSKEAMDILKMSEHDLGRWGNLIGQVASKRDLEELDGAMIRATEDYPDHPAVMAVRSAVAALKHDQEDAAQYGLACAQHLSTRYHADKAMIVRYGQWLIQRLDSQASEAACLVVSQFLQLGGAAMAHAILDLALSEGSQAMAIPLILDETVADVRRAMDRLTA